MARVQIYNPDVIIEVECTEEDFGKVKFFGEIVSAKSEEWKPVVGMPFDTGFLNKKEYRKL